MTDSTLAVARVASPWAAAQLARVGRSFGLEGKGSNGANRSLHTLCCSRQSGNLMSSKRTMGLAVSRRWRLEMQPCKSPSRGGWWMGRRPRASPMKIKGWRRSRPISARTAGYTDRQRRSGYTRGDESKKKRGNSGSRATVALPDSSSRGVRPGGVYSKQASLQRNDNRIARCLIRRWFPVCFKRLNARKLPCM